MLSFMPQLWPCKARSVKFAVWAYFCSWSLPCLIAIEQWQACRHHLHCASSKNCQAAVHGWQALTLESKLAVLNIEKMPA